MRASNEQASRLQVGLLGPITIATSDGSHELAGTKQKVLLAHLVLADGKPVSVRTLVDDMWGQDQPQNPHHALQVHVSRLRAAWDFDIELIANVGYRLVPETVASDTAKFKAILNQISDFDLGEPDSQPQRCEDAVNLIESALTLWRGPVFGGLSEAVGLKSHSRELLELRRDAEAKRIELLVQLGRSQSVVPDLRRLLQQDPLRDDIWYLLMSALYAAGRRSEALKAFQEARKIFIEELGSEPAAHLVDLNTEILRDEVGHGISSLGQHRATESPFVARHREIESLGKVWEAAQRELQLVTVSGEPGVGKTRLALEFAKRAHANGSLVLKGHCSRSVASPFEPFVHMLRSVLNVRPEVLDSELLQEHKSLLLRLLPETLGAETLDRHLQNSEESQSDPIPNYWRMSEALIAWLHTVAGEKPLLLLIDDVHWADEQTLLFLQDLVRGTHEIPILLLVTVRERELSPNSDSHHAVPELAGQLLRQSAHVTHIPLRRLDPSETTELVNGVASHLVDNPPLPEWADGYVQAASGGNPLYATELTRALLWADASMPDQAPELPSGLRQVVEARVASLPPDVSELLRQASVLGTRFDPFVLNHVVEASARVVDELLDKAIKAQLIQASPEQPPLHEFSHDVVRMVLYESIPPLQRAQLHSSAVEAIEKRYNDSLAEHHRVLAYHHRFSESADSNLRAGEQLVLAGQVALTVGAPADAEQLFAEAKELLSASAEADLLCDALIGLGTSKLRNANPKYRETLLAGARLAIELDDQQRLTAAVLANSRGWWSSTAVIDLDRIATIESALSFPHPADVRAMLLAEWASENARNVARREEVLRVCAEAVERAAKSGSIEAKVVALSRRYAVIYALFEDPVECLVTAERQLELANQTGDRELRLGASLCVAQARLRFADAKLAGQHIDHSLKLAEELNHPPRLWLALGWDAMRLATAGRLDDAEARAAEALELGTTIGQDDAFTWFAGQLFTIRLMQGRLAEILPAVQEHVADMSDGIPAWQAALAAALALTGHQDEAKVRVNQLAIDGFESLPKDMLWLNALCYLTMACEVTEQEQAAELLYEKLLPHQKLVASNGTIDAGPVDLYLGILARLTLRHEAAAEHFRAAERVSLKLGSPVWLAAVHRRQN